jgi:hypothetical protein
MLPRSKGPGTLVVAAALALMVAPGLALAQQSNPPPPAQIGNRVGHKEVQPNPAAICGSGAKETVDCSPQTDEKLQEIRQEIENPRPAQPGADSATVPPSATR